MFEFSSKQAIYLTIKIRKVIYLLFNWLFYFLLAKQQVDFFLTELTLSF